MAFCFIVVLRGGSDFFLNALAWELGAPAVCIVSAGLYLKTLRVSFANLAKSRFV